MMLVLDRHFVHRLRMVTGKDGDALNEVELLAHSLIHNDAVLRGNDVIRYAAEESVLQLGIGDQIRLSAAQFEELGREADVGYTGASASAIFGWPSALDRPT